MCSAGECQGLEEQLQGQRNENAKLHTENSKLELECSSLRDKLEALGADCKELEGELRPRKPR